MLRFSSQLLFPTLKFTPTVISNLDPKYKIYQLDWDSVDALKEKIWIKNRACSPTSAFPSTLPGIYLDWNDTMLFALPQSLVDEINVCSMKATEEWGRKKPELKWDPISTISPAASYTQTAFNIIADGLYDPNTYTFARDPQKILIPFMLLFRFWSYQVKTELLNHYTGINRLRDDAVENTDPEIYRDFIANIDDHMLKMQAPSKMEHANKIITKGTLKDFIENKKASVYVDNIVIDIPHTGKITLLKPKIIRSFKGMKLTAELGGINDAKIVLDVLQTRIPVCFQIQDSTCCIEVMDCLITDLSGTPPPSVTMEIRALSLNAFFIKESE